MSKVETPVNVIPFPSVSERQYVEDPRLIEIRLRLEFAFTVFSMPDFMIAIDQAIKYFSSGPRSELPEVSPKSGSKIIDFTAEAWERKKPIVFK